MRTALADASLVERLNAASRVNVVAAGKAAGPMLNAFAEALSSKNDSRLHFLVGIGPVRPAALPPRAEWLEAAHPVPDERSVRAARRALDVAADTKSRELLVVLLSGGASALMALPGEGITLEDKQRTVRQLLKGGATIDELNAVRKHLSAIKGGRLASATQGDVVTLAISDVVGDDLSVIGSGPTVPDPTTFADALAVLGRRGGRAAYPPAVVTLLERGQRGEIAETPKADDPRIARSIARIIGGRLDAVEGAVDEARTRGYHVHVIEPPIVGEARDAAHAFAGDMRQLARTLPRPACIVGAGETTVVVRGNGVGGRNQEFALAMLALPPVFFGSIGTDGIDGPTDAAGAVVDPTTAERAAALGLDPQTFLSNNDSYHFFSALDDLLRTGPTGTNVGDVQAALLP